MLIAVYIPIANRPKYILQVCSIENRPETELIKAASLRDVVYTLDGWSVSDRFISRLGLSYTD